MKTIRHRPTPRLAALSVAVASSIVPCLALAQDAASQDAAPTEATTTLDRIEVTGSRIPKAEIETAQPIITLSRADIQKQGFNSVADILQNLTSSGPPAISRADALASGESVGGYYIDMRNLGPQRVLVLLNGRRLGVDTAGLQDLSQIPFSAIERIEVLKDGASSIYGSDAITGVVNIITRKNFDGAEANAYVGTYDQGDGTKQSYDITIGATNDRGGLTLSAEYSKEDPVMAADRWFSEQSIPDPRYPYSGWSLISERGLWLFGNCPFDPRIAPFPACTLNPGTDPRDPNNYHSLDFPEKSNPNQEMFLQTGIERRALFVSGDLDLTDDLRFHTEIGYNQRSTSQQVAGAPGGLEVGPLSPDSYFNPTPGVGAYYFRRQWEVPRTNKNELNTLRASLGLEGVLNLGQKQWDWDVGFLSNRNQVDKRAHGYASFLALANAIGPSFLNPLTGRVECGSEANPIPYGSNSANGECIPYNPLLPYGQAGEGSLANPELQKYLFPELHDIGETQTTLYSANLAGSLFTLPAGDLGVAIGLEHRNESGNFVPDALDQSGQTQSLGGQTTAGSYSVDEAYLELDVPLLADKPFAKELGFNVSGRYSNYSSFGNTFNPKFSLRWRPTEDVLVRGTYANGFRAPTINDLYGGRSGSFEFYTDPCASGQPGAGNAVCTAAGVPANYIQLGQGQVPCAALPCQSNWAFISGSNPNLTPELAKSKTLGVVWSPRWVEGLDLSLDWYQIKMTNLISQDAVDSILADCYVANIASRCQGITRNPATHEVTGMFFGEVNLGALRTEGYDFDASYKLPEFAFGKIAFDWQTSYLSQLDTKADDHPDTPWFGLVGRQSGNAVNGFRVRSNLGVTWEKGDYSLSYTARYYSGIAESCAPDLPPAQNYLNYPPHPCDAPDHVDVQGNADPLRHVGSNTFHDLQFSMKLPWNARASIGVNNLTEHYGPIMYSTPNSDFAYYGGFDIGRFWYLKYQQKF